MRILLIKYTGDTLNAFAQTDEPAKARIMLMPMLLRKVLLPAMFEPVIKPILATPAILKLLFTIVLCNQRMACSFRS